MTQEDKQLLLRDLCARLPYNPIIYVNEQLPRLRVGSNTRIGEYVWIDNPCKPYLFPLSSMTEEQKEEYNKVCMEDLLKLNVAVIERNYCKSKIATPLYYAIDFLNKNHFDYRGLIEKGLAIDATDLNIY